MTQLRTLVVFHSDEGHTAEIAGRIAARVHEGGVDADLRAAEDAPDPDGYDGVVLGDSVHHSRHSHELVDYIRRHRESLEARPSALFQVSLASAATDAPHELQAHEQVQRLAEQTSWQPDLVGLFAGALAYTRYGWYRRHVARRIARDVGLAADDAADHDYTDWSAVDAFADHVVDHVIEHAARAPEVPPQR